MGIVRFEDNEKAELEEFRRMLLSVIRRKDDHVVENALPAANGGVFCPSLSGAAVNRQKDDDGFGGRENALLAGNGDVLDRLVCVTSGVSYIGIAIVNQLLVNGYSVRIVVDNEEDVEKLREKEISGEMRLNNSFVEVVMAKLTEVESLTQAFDGCRGVFHTASFVDPAGLSGYSKAMANIEVSASKNVIKACGISPSVRRCVLTSSLLTCIWRDNSLDEVSCVIDHNSWSDESVCMNKRLWYALGKLRAEKAAWEIAKETGLKLTTICPGLITGPEFYQRNPTSTLAYLKGVQEMYSYGLLATVDIERLAKAHVRVFEEMKKTASGRYICFDKVITNAEKIEKLVAETSISSTSVTGAASCSNRRQFELSNSKLARLMLRTERCRNE